MDRKKQIHGRGELVGSISPLTALFSQYRSDAAAVL